MSQLLKISIVTPSYNEGQFLEETIVSVLDQNYPNLEYIIIDGGSTDNSLEIIQKYEDRLAYWVSEPDQGQADAINKGFAHASGEILGWLNSDDTYNPNTIIHVVRYFVEHPEWSILYGESWYVDENSHRLSPCHQVQPTITRANILNRDPIAQPATFWRRSLWLTVGPLDSTLTWGFDWEWFIRAHSRTELHYVPEFLANFRLHSHMKTRTGGKTRHAELAKLSRRHGGWWQPTNLVYQANRPHYFVTALTSNWPKWGRRPLKLLSKAPAFVLSRVYTGRFMS